MTSKESLRNLKQEILTPNYLTDYEKDECIDVIQQDLERLETLEEENKELKSIIEEQSLKIANDSKEMSDMDLQIRQLKGEFMPLDCLK